jgi:hypothetical protein
MFEQIIAYLESLLPIPGYPGLRLGEEAIAATAVCLRWGSYLAVLADRDKPLWPQAYRPTMGRIRRRTKNNHGDPRFPRSASCHIIDDKSRDLI